MRRALFKIASSGRLRALLLALVALGATGVALLAYATSLLANLEGQSVDARFSIRGHQKAPKDIVIVKIDAKTFQDLNKQFPFPRALDGELLAKIGAEHPKVIAFDIQLSESSQLGQKDDIALLNDICPTSARHPDCEHPNWPPVAPIVFSNTEPNAKGDVRFLGSTEGTKLLHEIGAFPANGSLPSEGIIRRLAYEIDNLKTLDVVTAEVASHKRVSPSSFDHGQQWIDFRGPGGTYPSVSFSDVVPYKGKPASQKLPPDFFKGKIVIVGTTATTLQDIHATPFDPLMAGAEIHANAIDTVLRGFPLTSDQGWINVLLIIVLGTAVPLVSLRLGPIAATTLAFALGGAYVVVAQLAFNSGTVISVTYPLVALVLSFGGALSVQLITEAFQRVRTRDLFARFVPEDVVDEVLKSADGLRLGGVQREGTVMFTDLRGFTSLAESLQPARVIDILNHYLSEMSDAILDHGGTLVAYMGDGIMAVFGAPLAQTDHADRALASAREMLTVRLPRFNQWLRAEGLSEGFKMGIGLNSGSVMSGHVGSERRVEYTAVGDTTNTASRIEGMTKGTPHQLFLSESTRKALSVEPDDLIYVDEMPIRGRVEPLKMWSLRGQEQPIAPESLKASGPAV